MRGLAIILLSLFLIGVAVPLISPITTYSQQTTLPPEEHKITVAVDLGHGESDKYLNYIMGNITFVNWKIINGTVTADELKDVDIFIIGQPTTGFTPDEMKAISDWLASGNKAIWVAGDSDYGGGPASQKAANDLLAAIGAKLRVEYGSVYDDIHCAGRFYRVLGYVKPDIYTGLFTYIISEGITKPVLYHGPAPVVWVDENGKAHDPVNDTFPGLIRIVWTGNTAYAADNNPPPPMVYNPLFYGKGTGNHTFVLLAAEYHFKTNDIIVVSGESPYGDYEPTWAWYYHGVALDGPKFVTNMIRWMVTVLTFYEKINAIGKPTVAVDLAHGESDKYLNYIMGNITFVNWKIINTTITEDTLKGVDALIIGQPTTGFTPDEMKVIKDWLASGNKAIWVAGDSDYGGGPASQKAANDLLAAIGAKLRVEYGSVYDDIHCAGRFYRVLGYVNPDNITGYFTYIIRDGITKPVLYHGPAPVVWVDENGKAHDPVNETFPGLIRIVWTGNTAYAADNNPPAPMVYNPLFYGKGTGNHTFVLLAAEYHKDKNDLIIVSGESPYGDYEPTWAWYYHGVALDGPKFVTNMIRWMFTLLNFYEEVNKYGKLTVAVDLAHGESDKYLNYIMGNITFVNWKVINSTITAGTLKGVDILIIGQPTTGFTPDEMKAISDWLASGDKIMWVAGDSDYGGGPSSQKAANDLLAAIGAKLRVEYGSVYDDIHCAGRFYRVLGYVKPDAYPGLDTLVISDSVTKPVLYHGPAPVVWVDENGKAHDPVNETFPGLIRIVWTGNTAYAADNNPPAPMVYNPLFYGKGTGNHTFVLLAAEYHFKTNDIIVVSGESPYGDYEPTWAWYYHGVALSGPEFVTNMIRWFVLNIYSHAVPPTTNTTTTTTTTSPTQTTATTPTTTITTTQSPTTTTLPTSPTTTTTPPPNYTPVLIAAIIIAIIIIIAALALRRR